MRHHAITAASLVLLSGSQLVADLCIPCPNPCAMNFYAEVDGLLWFANQEGLSYASTVDASIPSPALTPFGSAVTMREQDHFFSNKWDSGVRVNLGFKPAQRGWDVNLGYTYFNTSIRSKPIERAFTNPVTGTATGSAVFNDYVPNNLGVSVPMFNPIVTVSGNHSKWCLQFNQIDLEIGRDYQLVEDATFRPFFGLRGLFTHQKLTEENPFNGFVETLSFFSTTSLFKATNCFNGVGAKAGLEGSYKLWYGIDIYGSLGGSILWGRFKVDQAVDVVQFTSSGVRSLLSAEELTHSHFASLLNLDIDLGIRWSYLFENRHLLTLKFAWEQHFFTNMNQFQNFVLENSVNTGFLSVPTNYFTFDRNVQRGNLSLSGFTFGILYTY